MPKLFDIHSHLNDKLFDKDISEVISRMEEQNVWTITVGTDKKMSWRACEIAQMGKGLFASVGMHPTDNADDKFDVDFFEGLALGNDKVVAIGECGLEYFRIPAEKEAAEKKKQKQLFEDQIELAVTLDKPLMIHCRDAHDDVMDILRSKKREYGDVLRGDIHFFSGDVEMAKKYFDIDFTISFTGVITFASQYDDVIAYAP
ncbi:MAG: TatD family hydrolase, partial [Candidatus Pacebacteria bacterium]|nr:TatD family hydrolase [Candidatus Paceibacterota bacterium]